METDILEKVLNMLYTSHACDFVRVVIAKNVDSPKSNIFDYDFVNACGCVVIPHLYVYRLP